MEAYEMTALEILQAARAAGISVGVEGDQIALEAASKPDDALVAEILGHKQEILGLLCAEQEHTPITSADMREAAPEPLPEPPLAAAHLTPETSETGPDPVDDGATPLRTVAPPPSPPQTPGSSEPADQAALKPARLANGQLLWRFRAGPVTDISPLPLMLRARNRGAQLVRDGDILIVTAWQQLHPEVLHGLARHAGAILAHLSRESAERIAAFRRGEGGPVTEVFDFDPKQEAPILKEP
jgi:hypothetical protein